MTDNKLENLNEEDSGKPDQKLMGKVADSLISTGLGYWFGNYLVPTAIRKSKGPNSNWATKGFAIGTALNLLPIAYGLAEKYFTGETKTLESYGFYGEQLKHMLMWNGVSLIYEIGRLRGKVDYIDQTDKKPKDKVKGLENKLVQAEAIKQ
jgi:hypothetical protein